MPRLALATCLLSAWGSSCAPPEDGAAPRATADGELLEGSPFGAGGKRAVFKGIPYAAPPVGPLRWAPPVAVSPRSDVRPAVDYGPACVQTAGNVEYTRDVARALGSDPAGVPDLGRVSEDCLTLNVWTSNFGGEPDHPVMVWIYGGSNIWGTADEIPYDGANLAEKGVVVVTFNYRVGIFGYYAHAALSAESPNGSSGNYGLLDQIAALEWVQRNIASFGGDPNRVTIFGESAGAVNVGLLLASPLAEGLFHRAISQSGGYQVSDLRTLAEEEERGRQLEQLLALGVESEDALRALRATSAETLLRASGEYLDGDYDCSPVADGWSLPESVGPLLASGRQNDVPLIIGSNADEWTSLRHYFPETTSAGLEKNLSETYGEHAREALELYGPVDPELAASLQAAIDRWQTDFWYTCPNRWIARRMEGVGSDAYLYLFTRRLPGATELGAWHAAEMAYVFDNLADEVWAPRDETDRALADAMSSYWVQFASQGDPNREGLPEWPVYESSTDRHLELGDQIVAGDGLRRQACDLYDAVLDDRIRASRNRGADGATDE